MEDDFRIIRDGEHWKVLAISERAREFATVDGRLKGNETIVPITQILALYRALTREGLFVGTPDGLPAQSARPLLLALLVLLTIILLPVLLIAIF